MAITIDWHIPHRVILQRLWGDATAADMDVHFSECMRLLQEAYAVAPNNKVHLLLDAVEAESLVPLYREVERGSRLIQQKNRGILFLATRNRAVRAVIEITARLGGQHFPLHVFQDMPHAIEALNRLLEKEDAQR